MSNLTVSTCPAIVAEQVADAGAITEQDEPVISNGLPERVTTRPGLVLPVSAPVMAVVRLNVMSALDVAPRPVLFN